MTANDDCFHEDTDLSPFKIVHGDEIMVKKELQNPYPLKKITAYACLLTKHVELLFSAQSFLLHHLVTGNSLGAPSTGQMSP